MSWLKSTKDGVLISIRLTPRAKRDSFDGLHGNSLKVKIKAPPVDGKANAYLLKFMAQQLDLPQANVSLVRGETSREKLILVAGTTEEQIAGRIIPQTH